MTRTKLMAQQIVGGWVELMIPAGREPDEYLADLLRIPPPWVTDVDGAWLAATAIIRLRLE